MNQQQQNAAAHAIATGVNPAYRRLHRRGKVSITVAAMHPLSKPAKTVKKMLAFVTELKRRSPERMPEQYRSNILNSVESLVRLGVLSNDQQLEVRAYVFGVHATVTTDAFVVTEQRLIARMAYNTLSRLGRLNDGILIEDVVSRVTLQHLERPQTCDAKLVYSLIKRDVYDAIRRELRQHAEGICLPENVEYTAYLSNAAVHMDTNLIELGEKLEQLNPFHQRIARAIMDGYKPAEIMEAVNINRNSFDYIRKQIKAALNR